MPRRCASARRSRGRRAVVCIGMNYAAHAAESGSAPPENLVMFMKTPNTVVGPYDDVAIPRGSVEDRLGGRARRRDRPPGLATSTRRPRLARTSPATSSPTTSPSATGSSPSPAGSGRKGKCAPGFNPLGPWLVTPDEVDADDVRLRSWVNGEPRQDSRTADLIFGVDHIVWHLSQYLALEPGDLILTGTPEGVALSGRFPYLAPGDVVELEIDGLGRQRQHVVAA